MRIKCTIIEDEPLARERLVQYIRKLDYLELVGTYTNGLEAVSGLKEASADLIFLDIEMDQLNGMELLSVLPIIPKVIIISAYEEYALEGYQFNVTDYLLKPYTWERWLQAVDKVYYQLQSNATNDITYIFIKTASRLEKVGVQEIRFISGMGDYRSLHLKEKRILTTQTFGDLAQLLPASKFCRVHKSYMVGLDHIDYVERNRIRIGEELVPVSETYRKGFMEWIGR